MANQLLKKLSGAQISAEEIRLLTNRGGQQRAMQQQEEAEQASIPPTLSPLQRSAYGSMGYRWQLS